MAPRDSFLEMGNRIHPERLVAQGRLGKKSGQGFYPYPSPAAEQKETVLLEWRDDVAILWLNRPPMSAHEGEADLRVTNNDVRFWPTG